MEVILGHCKQIRIGRYCRVEVWAYSDTERNHSLNGDLKRTRVEICTKSFNLERVKLFLQLWTPRRNEKHRLPLWSREFQRQHQSDHSISGKRKNFPKLAERVRFEMKINFEKKGVKSTH